MILAKTVPHASISAGRVLVTTPSIECREQRDDTLVVIQNMTNQIRLTPTQAIELSLYLRTWGLANEGVVVSR